MISNNELSVHSTFPVFFFCVTSHFYIKKGQLKSFFTLILFVSVLRKSIVLIIGGFL